MRDCREARRATRPRTRSAGSARPWRRKRRPRCHRAGAAAARVVDPGWCQLHDRQAAITLSWPTSGAREDDELLGRSGHRDIAVDRSFDTPAERLWVDEDD